MTKGNSQTFEQQTSNVNERQNMIKVLGGITFSFLFLHSLRLTITFGEFFLLLTSHMNNEMWCLQRGYGVPVWLEIATAANKMLKVVHSSANVTLYLYLNWGELVKEWPLYAPNFLKSFAICRACRHKEMSPVLLYVHHISWFTGPLLHAYNVD